MEKVKIFVSSTCYDLAQIRRDLENFITEMGYEPIMSDSPNIPIPEGLNKIEVCKWMVRNSDVFVLIIGGRYGSTDEKTGKSITMIEYETALSAKIPIYVFVDKEVWMKKDTYKKIKEMADIGDVNALKIKEILGGKIENPQVFELIRQIDTEEGGKWINEFQTVSDIISKLKNSWSLEFKTLLNTRSEKLKHLELRDIYRPVLRVSWLLDGNVMNILSLKRPSKYDRDELIKKYKSLMVSVDELKKVENKKGELTTVLKNINYKKLGLPNPVENIESILSLPKKFNSLMEYYIDQINNNFEDFLGNFDASQRAAKPSFQIGNDGKVPAEGVIIYIKIPEGVGVVFEKDLSFNIEKRFSNVEVLLKIMQNLDSLYKQAKEIEEKPIVTKSFSDLTSLFAFPTSRYPGPSSWPLESLGSAIVESPYFSPKPSKIPTVLLEDGNIRINLSLFKLKHGFVYNEDSDLYFYLTSLKSEGKLQMSYVCHADNLPIPDSGELVIEVI